MSLIIWNSEIEHLLSTGVLKPSMLVSTPYFKNMSGVRKSGLDFSYTADERSDRERVHTIKTIPNFVPRDFQEDAVQTLIDRRFNLLHTPRQAGATTIMAVKSLADALNGKSTFYIAPNGAMAQSFVERVKSYYLKLPFYLRPGVTAWNERSIQFENCSIVAKDQRSVSKSEKEIFKGFDSFMLDGADYFDRFSKIYNDLVTQASEKGDLTVQTIRGDREGILRKSTLFAYNLIKSEFFLDKNRLDEIRKMYNSKEEFDSEYTTEFDSVIEPVGKPGPEGKLGKMGNIDFEWHIKDIENSLATSEPKAILKKVLMLMRHMANKNNQGQ
jgi:hypothetical protein